jgi:hypothetical protein
MLAELITVIPLVPDRIRQLWERRVLGTDDLKHRRIMAGAAGQLERDTGLFVENASMECGGTSTPRAAQSLCRLVPIVVRAPAAC